MTYIRNIKDLSSDSSGRTAIESVYNALRQAILVGEITPGSRLRVEGLRQEFGVGSSTVREALSRLLVENLVTTEGQRGFRAAAVSIEDFKNIVKMRALLEAQAVRASMANADDAWESNLVAAHHSLAKIENEMAGQETRAFGEWTRRNRAFHDALIARCTNSWLLNFREILYSHSERYLQISLTDKSIPRDVRAEHQAIFEAVIAREIDKAEELTVQHIFNTVPAIEARLAAQEIPYAQVAQV